MNIFNKTNELCSIVEKQLLSEICGDYYIYGIPFYSNVGDMLIYQGTLEFLKKTNHKCLGGFFLYDYQFPKISSNVVLIVQGGGYFGDLWRKGWNPVIELVKRYPHNKIIIMPQSIYYSDLDLAKQDAEIFSNHENIIICSRDYNSYTFAKEFFNNRIILIPDMAFFMDLNIYARNIMHTSSKDLYLKRYDKESVDFNIDVFGKDVRDWPTLDSTYKKNIQILCEKMFLYYRKLICRWPFLRNAIKFIIYNVCFSWIYKPLLIHEGVAFINNYNIIYTSRLHGLILSFLLGKQIVLLDNSYGKLQSFYDTWLKDVDTISLLPNINNKYL